MLMRALPLLALVPLSPLVVTPELKSPGWTMVVVPVAGVACGDARLLHVLSQRRQPKEGQPSILKSAKVSVAGARCYHRSRLQLC